VKPKLLWRPKDIVDARNVKYLLRKTIGIEWSQPERAALWAVPCKAKGAGLLNNVGAHITIPCALATRYEGTGFNVCPAGF
jgi:hypothetical protein